jgi:cytochrome c-type biogenesis protein CcmE
VELTPREESEVPTPSRGRAGGSSRRWVAGTVIGVLLAVMGVLVYKGLSEATLYFRTADEAVADKASLGTRRFRLEGTVVAKPVEKDGTVTFEVTQKGVDVPVHHTGSPPELFKQGIPVVLEGHWDESGAFFASDHILVKHDEKYESKDDYDKRMSEAGTDGSGGSSGG